MSVTIKTRDGRTLSVPGATKIVGTAAVNDAGEVLYDGRDNIAEIGVDGAVVNAPDAVDPVAAS